MSQHGHCIALFVSIAVLTSFAANDAGAQLSDDDRAKLVGQIEAAATSVDPMLFPDLDQSKAEVLKKVLLTEQFFDSSTSAKNRDAWLDYLGLDALVQKIESESDPPAIAREAVDLRFRLVGTSRGLELTVLRNLRDAVEQLIHAVRFRDVDSATKTVSRQLGALAARVQELDSNPSAEDTAIISALLGILESSGQAEETVSSLRNTFSHPNVAILIGEPLVQSALSQPVDRTRPVRDCILGTRIHGTAKLTGNVNANLLPGTGAAKMNLKLVGKVVSRNIGRNGPVRLRTIGHGEVSAWRSLTVSESGIVLAPTHSRAVLDTKITAIEHKLALVRKIARKKAAQQKAQAEKIATERMRLQIDDLFTTSTSEAAKITPPDPLRKLRPVLTRLSLDEPARVWGSTKQAIFIDSTLRRRDQISTVVSRPPILESYDAAVQMHESAIDNAFAPVLAGRTLNEEQLNELLEEAGRPVPDQEQADDDGESEPPFEIDFARLRPIVFEARDQKVRLGVRGTRFAQGTRELKRAIEISAVYESLKTDGGMAVLSRTGNVEVSFPGGKRLTVSQVSLKRTIQKTFADVFPKVLLDRPLEVPDDAKLKSVRGRVFHPRMVDARGGWLTITFR